MVDLPPSVEEAKEFQEKKDIEEGRETKVVVPIGGSFRGKTAKQIIAEQEKKKAVAAPKGGLTQAEIQRRFQEKQARKAKEEARKERLQPKIIEPTKKEIIRKKESEFIRLAERPFGEAQRVDVSELRREKPELAPEIAAEARIGLLEREIKQTIPEVTPFDIDIEFKPGKATIEELQPFIGKQIVSEVEAAKEFGRQDIREQLEKIVGKEVPLRERAKAALRVTELLPSGLKEVGLARERERGLGISPELFVGTAIGIPAGIISTTIRRGPAATIESAVFGTAELFIRPQEVIKARTLPGVITEVGGIITGGELVATPFRLGAKQIRNVGIRRFERAIQQKPSELAEFALIGKKEAPPSPIGVEMLQRPTIPSSQRLLETKELIDLTVRKVPPTKKLLLESGEVAFPVKPEVQFKFVVSQISRERLVQPNLLKALLRSKKAQQLVTVEKTRFTTDGFFSIAKPALDISISKTGLTFPTIISLQPTGERVLEDVALASIVIPESITIERQQITPIAKERLDLKQEFEEIQKPKPIVILPKQRTIQKQRKKVVTALLVEEEKVVTQIPIEKVKPIPKIPEAEKPTLPFVLREEKERIEKKRKPRQGFDAQVKKKGKFVTINEMPLPKNRALNLALREADRSPAVTARTVMAKRPTDVLIDESVDGILLSKFQRRLDKEGKGSVFVEKNMFRLDSLGELRGIQKKGVSARRKAFGGFM